MGYLQIHGTLCSFLFVCVRVGGSRGGEWGRKTYRMKRVKFVSILPSTDNDVYRYHLSPSRPAHDVLIFCVDVQF